MMEGKVSFRIHREVRCYSTFAIANSFAEIVLMCCSVDVLVCRGSTGYREGGNYAS